jgi:nucleoside-diphosphate-sugar epimerase
MNTNEKRIKLTEDYFNICKLDNKLKRYYKSRNILVTGGAGAIGSNLIIELSELVGKNGKVIVLDNLSSIKIKKPWNVTPLQNILFVEGDIRNEVHLKRVFKEDISLVFHLAAFFANQNSVDYTEVSAKVDIIGIIKLLEYSQLAKIDRFIYASSGCAIYGSYAKMPLKEDFVSMHLTTPYQINKMTGEMYCNFFAHHYGMKTVNCRFFNSYGPGEVPGQYRNVIPNFIYWSMKGKPLPITGSGKETRDFTYVLDLVQGLIKAGFYDTAIGANFNLAAGKEISIIDMANLIKNSTGSNAPFIFMNRRKWDTKPRLLASIEKAKKLIDYKPIINFKDGIMENIKWFKENWDLIERLSDFTPGMSSAVRDNK